MEPWQSRCSSLSEMHLWAAKLPVSIPAAVRHLLISELAFSSIILMRPPGTPNSLCSYGEALLFDYAVKFAEATFNMCSLFRSYNYCTSHDILRTLLVGQALVQLLQGSPTIGFNVPLPSPPPLPAGSMAPPGLQRRSFEEHIDDAMNAITRLDQIVKSLSHRFGFPPSCKKYQYDSTTILQTLYSRRQQQDLPDMNQPPGAYLGPAVPNMVLYQDASRGYLPL